MFVDCTGEAKLRVRETGEVFTVVPKDLDWDSEGVGEGGMGGEVRHWATVEFQSSQTGKTYSVTWQLWEYPEGVQDNQESDFGQGLECLTDFDYGLVHEPEFDEDEAKRDEGHFLRFGENFSSAPPFGGSQVGNAETSSEAGGNDVKQSASHALSYLTKARAETLAERDFLGRQHITEALRQLIAEREGTQHFALGLFGSWGSGKSSLILHLAEQLNEKHPEILIAEFNAWKNEKASNLGAMLAQSVVECLTADLNVWQKFCLAIKLVDARNAWLRKGVNKYFQAIFPWLLVLSPPLMLIMVVVLLVWALPLPGGDWVRLLSVSVSVIAVAYQSTSLFLRNNLGEWFKHINAHKVLLLFRLPSYSEHRGLAAEIHQTLGYLCALQLGQTGREKTLLLIVDDLDRCSVNTVKEVFDAVRLVADIPRVITLVAIDEQMAFAAVEKYYDLFGHAGRPSANVARDYLGKVLQASITLPIVDDEYVQAYVENVLFPGVGETKHSSGVQYNQNPHVSSKHSSKSVSDETAGSDTPDSPDVSEPATKQLSVTSQSALTEEMHLFRELAVQYDFRNPRQMGRLYLSWRLLKALVFGGRAYAMTDVENRMRLLFWREYRLQQDIQRRDELDEWLTTGCERNGPQNLVPALGRLTKEMIGDFLGKSWDMQVKLADAILLPASSVATKR